MSEMWTRQNEKFPIFFLLIFYLFLAFGSVCLGDDRRGGCEPMQNSVEQRIFQLFRAANWSINNFFFGEVNEMWFRILKI